MNAKQTTSNPTVIAFERGSNDTTTPGAPLFTLRVLTSGMSAADVSDFISRHLPGYRPEAVAQLATAEGAPEGSQLWAAPSKKVRS